MCGFQRFLEACILHEVFAEYQRRLRMFLCKTTFAENWFWRVAEFDVEMMKMVFAIFMAIWNVVYCLRMCMLDNKLQTFFNLILFDNSIVSPQGLVWHRNQERNNKTQKGHTVICEPGSNKCTMRKPRLPPARSLEITECKPHGQHLTDSWTQASNDAVMWQMEVEQEKTDLR